MWNKREIFKGENILFFSIIEREKKRRERELKVSVWVSLIEMQNKIELLEESSYGNRITNYNFCTLCTISLMADLCLINHHITVATPLSYLRLLLSAATSSSMAAFLLLPFVCGCGCCSNDSNSVSDSVVSSWFSSFAFAFIMCGFSLLTSHNRTGFRKNSSAPSSKHLCFA